MDRSRLLTAGITILAATATVGLMALDGRQAAPQPGAMADAAARDAAPVAATADMPVDVTPVSAQGALLDERAGPAPSAGRQVVVLDLPEDRPPAPRLASPGAELRNRMALLDAPDTATPPATGATSVRRNALGVPCGVNISGTARAPGIAAVTVTAPCRPEARVTVRHGGLVFTDSTDTLGTFRADIPALTTPAAFTVRFADGTQAELELDIPDLAGFSRVALQWQGESGLSLHALEFGAVHGEPGHVWSGAKRGPEHGASGRGGFVTRLGDGTGPAPRFAEIYTFPEDRSRDDGVVRLSIEAEVTEANCGREVKGQSLQAGPGGAFEPVTLTLAMPDCAAVGEFLVLKNVLRDLRIAAN